MDAMNLVNESEFKALCDLTARLTELRQQECKHLCIENFANECLGNLIIAVIDAKKQDKPSSLLEMVGNAI